jgi:hypothetical protein
MRKIITFFAAVMLLTSSFASIPMKVSPGTLYASQIMIPIGKDGKTISLLELSKITKSDLEKMTGRKMSGIQALAFKGAQKKMNKGIDDKGIVTSKKMKKMFVDGETGFHLGGFALGFFLGLIGVLVAYILKDDYSANRRKWAWIGLGAGVILSIILFAIVFKSVTNNLTP